jgi:hypothetical protein
MLFTVWAADFETPAYKKNSVDEKKEKKCCCLQGPILSTTDVFT